VRDDHEIVKVRETTQSELVLETKHGGRACVTRVFLRPVSLAHDARVRDACLHGATLPDGLPSGLLIDGAVAAGVSASMPRIVQTPPSGHGYAYVTVTETAADATVVDARTVAGAERTIAVPEHSAPVKTIFVPDDPAPAKLEVLRPAQSNSLLFVVVALAVAVIVLLGCALAGLVILA
jgi:hypothetical protein